MADREPTPLKQKNGVYNRIEFGEVTISQADTVTFNGFDSTSTIWTAVFYNKSNGTAVTATTALNVATITGAVTNAPCWYLAYGIKV